MTPRPDHPWLSVLMPVHGGARFLGATLASAAAQVAELGAEGGGIEFLCYDSGDDGGAARAVAQDFSGALAIVWRDVPAIKPWTAKTNLAAAEARAPHVTMLHQDDLWLAGHGAALAGAVSAMAAGAGAGAGAVLSVGPSRFVGPQGQDCGPWRLPFAPGRHAGAALAATLIVQNTIAIPAPVISRAAFLAAGGLDDALWYTADWDLWLKLMLAGDVLVREGATTGFRLHGGSLTMTGAQDGAALAAQHEAVLARYLPRLAPPAGVLARAHASVAVNGALAGAACGQWRALWPGALALARLGPWGWPRFFHDTRLAERFMARARLRGAGRI